MPVVLGKSDAQDALGISGSEGREEDVLLEGQKKFESLSSAEQEEMRVPEGGDDEPECNRKAREQAERREREWEEQANVAKKKHEREEAIAREEPVEDDHKGGKRYGASDLVALYIESTVSNARKSWSVGRRIVDR
jgi:hypothetical protein